MSITANQESKELLVDLELILYSISLSKYGLKDKNSIRKQNTGYLLKGNIFFVENGRYRFIYTISAICVVLMYLVECSQKYKIFSFIIHAEKLIKISQLP